MSDRITAQQRRAVMARANQYCEYCYSSMAYSAQSFSVEHTIPRVKGGRNTLENLALACQGCNNFKHTKTEVFDSASGQMVPLFNPRKHQWSEHFRWKNDYMIAIGITPIGRVTVQTLKLNRTGVVNLRRALFILGEHPPIETLR